MTIVRENLRRPRRGSAYVLVLGLAMMIAVIGIGSLAVARVSFRNAAARDGEAEAEVLAMAAVEQALTLVAAAADAADQGGPAWRTAFTHGQMSPERELGGGTCRWWLEDATGDEDLADDPGDPILAFGRAEVGDAVRLTSVLLVPAGAGLEVLQTALHTAGDLVNDFPLTVGGGPASVAGALYNHDTITGNVDAGSVAVMGTINGSVNTPAPPKAMPPPDVVQAYLARATPIGWWDFDAGSGLFEPGLLSAAVNPYGPVNDDGVYRIHVPSWGQFKIKDSRIHGTLVITGDAGAKIKFQDHVLMSPHRPDYPVIIAGGAGVKVQFGWPVGTLSEVDVGVNLNPPHTPYEGESDNDTADVYAPGIKGLVHVFGAASEPSIGDVVDPEKHLTLTGTLVSEADVVTNQKGSATMTADPALFLNPPIGYSEGDRVAPLPGSWRWETE